MALDPHFDLIFDGVRLTKDLLKVTNVSRTVLPPKNVRLLDVPVRDGSYFAGTNYGARVIEVDVIMMANDPTTFVKKMRQLAFYLDTDMPVPLWFSDEPAVMYFALVAENTNIDELLSIGKGTIRFICPDPFGYDCETVLLDDEDGEELWEVVPTDTVFTTKGYTPTSTSTDRLYDLENLGTANAYPIFNTVFKKDSSFLSLVSPQGSLMIGNPKKSDLPAYKSVETIFKDGMGSISGWNSAGSLTNTQGGGNADVITTGAMGAKVTTDGASVMYASNFGTASSKWHGPSVRKDFPSNRTAEEFKFMVRFQMWSEREASSADEKEKGMFRVAGWTASGKRIFMFQMWDGQQYYEANDLRMWLGDSVVYEPDVKLPKQKYKQVKSGYKEITEKYKDKKGKIQTRKKKVPTYKNVKIDSGQAGIWNNWNGEFYLERRKKKSKSGAYYYEYTPKLYRIVKDSKGRTSLKWAGSGMKSYTDTTANGGWKYVGGEPLAFITVQFCQYAADVTMKTMQASHMYVQELYPDKVNESPIIFEAGDEVEVNCFDNSVTKNGEPFMQNVDIGSVFFPIEPGTMETVVNSDDNTAVHEARLVQRYL